ncbi:MAG: PQQ-dependent sugar dehydrogenase [Bauldia sp.]
MFILFVFAVSVAHAGGAGAGEEAPDRLLTGQAAFGDWQTAAPGVRRLIRPADMPAPYSTRRSVNGADVVRRPDGATPQVPAGFAARLFAENLDGPRVIRVAPNGDVFVAESEAGRVRVFRTAEGVETPSEDSVFADGFSYPYGIAFYPPGPNPTHVYIAETGRVVRFAYRSGDLVASGPAQTVVAKLPAGGHASRDIAFSPDGTRLFVSVGSGSNVAEGLPGIAPGDLREIESTKGLGAAWGPETDRAAVLAFDPDGGNQKTFATGIRNCSGLAIDPAGSLWCATNERDGLGDDLPPDYISRIGEGKFYGWPWFYIGDHEDPRQAGKRPELAGKVTVPDVLIQPHSAPLNVTFYDGAMFPKTWGGDGFATLHGSWNRGHRTGYKVVRIVMKDGKPTGEYEDFMTGFVVSDDLVWGRPVGVAVAKDGALLISEDGNGTIWRVSYRAESSP